MFPGIGTLKSLFDWRDKEVEQRAAKRRDELIRQFSDAQQMQALTEHPGWRLFEAQVKAEQQRVQEELTTAKIEKVPMLQATLQLYTNVLSIVPRALQDAATIQEEIRRMSEEG